MTRSREESRRLLERFEGRQPAVDSHDTTMGDVGIVGDDGSGNVLVDYAPPPYDNPPHRGHPVTVWRKCEFCADGRVHPEAKGWRCDRCYGFWTGDNRS